MEPDPSVLPGARGHIQGPLCFKLCFKDHCAGNAEIIDATVMDGAERHDPPEHLSNETAALRGA